MAGPARPRPRPRTDGPGSKVQRERRKTGTGQLACFGKRRKMPAATSSPEPPNGYPFLNPVGPLVEFTPLTSSQQPTKLEGRRDESTVSALLFSTVCRISPFIFLPLLWSLNHPAVAKVTSSGYRCVIQETHAHTLLFRNAHYVGFCGVPVACWVLFCRILLAPA